MLTETQPVLNPSPPRDGPHDHACGGAEVEVILLRGCGIYCTVTLLAHLRVHGCNGRSLSHVIEVSRPDMPVAPSQAEIAAASAAQPALPLRKAFGDWRPERFTGAKLKWGAGLGVVVAAS